MRTQFSLSVHRLTFTAVGIFLVTALLLVSPGTVLSQEEATERPEANPEDVESPEAIVESAFDAISNSQWERFRSLHHPNFKWITLERRNGELHNEIRTLDETVNSLRQAVGDTVLQQPASTEVERQGELAHVLVTVETRTAPAGEVVGRGLDTLELWYDGNRWWIMSVL